MMLQMVTKLNEGIVIRNQFNVKDVFKRKFQEHRDQVNKIIIVSGLAVGMDFNIEVYKDNVCTHVYDGRAEKLIWRLS